MLESISDLVIDNITRCAVGVDRYAILDFPDHSNVGDSAIYLGERKVLSSIAGCEPAYVSSVLNHNDRVIRDFGDSDIIFLHGGGNFGDVWPLHQKFRERVMKRFPAQKMFNFLSPFNLKTKKEPKSLGVGKGVNSGCRRKN